MRHVATENIDEFRDIGATILRGFWSDVEVDGIEQAISDVAVSPSSMVDVFEQDENGNTVFFNDFNNWRRIPSVKDISFNPKVGAAFCELTGSSNAYFFHDHVICKKAGATKRTPWHMDKSYFMVDSPYCASFWMPTVGLTDKQSLAFAKGSHLSRNMLMPKGFKSNNSLESSNEFLPFTEDEIETKYDSISWSMNRGDVLAFNFYTVHSAPSCIMTSDRKALSLRLIGDNSTFDGRVENPAPPFTQMGYKGAHGDPIREAWFPKYK